MLDVMRFWLDRGVDGFRVDAIHHLIEAEHLKDNPHNPDWRPGDSPARRLIRLYSLDQDETHDAIAAMRRVSDSYGPDRLLIGEASLPIEQLMRYYGVSEPGFHLPFNFHLIKSAWKPDVIARLIETYEGALPQDAWPNWVLGNHDRPRVVTRIGARQARVAAMLLLTIRGTPTIYQGEELGMADVPVPPDRVQDPWEKNVPGLGLGRDPERTPMQWDVSHNAGFTTGEPWLPIGENYVNVNVAAERADPTSMLSLYRELIRLRRAEPALSVGMHLKAETVGPVLIYRRQHDNRRILVALNFSRDRQEVPVTMPGEVLISTHLDRTDVSIADVLRLRPNEGVVIGKTVG
jgi:alpha-glucosidase